MKSLLATVSLVALLTFPVLAQTSDKMSDDKSAIDSSTMAKPTAKPAARHAARSPLTQDPEHDRIVELNRQQLQQIERQGGGGTMSR